MTEYWSGNPRASYLDGEAKLEPVQRVADPDLPLDFCVGQGRHDGSGLHVRPTCRHVPYIAIR